MLAYYYLVGFVFVFVLLFVLKTETVLVVRKDYGIIDAHNRFPRG